MSKPVPDNLQCRVQYERIGGRQSGDRVIQCNRVNGHFGDHHEIIDGEVANAWPAVELASEAGLALLGAVMARNAKDAAYASNAVIDGYIRERNDMARALKALADGLWDLPHFVRSVAIQNLLDVAEMPCERAEKYLREEDLADVD